MIKVCGNNDAAFARQAERLGVDYLGFIFHPRSPRAVTPAEARAIVASLSGHATPVGVFVHQTVPEILAIVREVGLPVVQLHSPAYAPADATALQVAGCEVWQAVTDAIPSGHPADAFLIEAPPRNGLPGGTGSRSDWSLVAEAHRLGRRAVLAGGLSADNLADALATGCDIVDVNSSLESAPGRKDPARLETLLRVYRHCEDER